MNTKALALIIVFAALTVVLNPVLTGIGVPAPYAPFLIYQIWEIPIVAAFLLLGSKYGISISLLNAVVLLAIFPGALITGPIYNLIAISSMLLGIYVVNKLGNRRAVQGSEKSLKYKTALVTAATATAIILRVVVMTVVNYVVLRYPSPVGYSLPEEAIISYLPLIGLFNATLALYTVPIGYVIANAIRTNLKINK